MAYTRRATASDATWARAWTADAVADLTSLQTAGLPKHGDVAYVTANTTWYLWRDDGTWFALTAGGGTWGSITGTLSSQTDLNTALGGKSPIATVVSSTLTGAQNNWAPTLASSRTLVEWNGASDAAFTGLVAGVAGQLVTVKNITTTKFATFAQQSGSSSAGNKFRNRRTNGATCVGPLGYITYQYDGTDWVQVGHDQGDRFRCHAYQNAAQSITNNLTMAVTFDIEVFDVGGLHDNVTNKSRFTIPVGGAGHWIAQCHCGFLTSTNGRFIVGLNKNGSQISMGFDLQATPTSGDMELTAPAILVEAAEGDYFEMTAYQNTGVAVNTNWGATYVTSMIMLKVD